MDNRKFKFWNRIVALAVFLVAAVTYLLTIEPSVSFWDCGEFIASSYKLEVGHPPGNPVFQLFARFATMFTGAENAAVAVNAMNAILSALTILLLYLTTVFLVKRLVKKEPDGTYSLAKSIVIFGSGAVGALAYTFSDTFWFSAVEGEVYAMSSLFTALVFWAMTKWYEQADEPYANRWLVLIAFLMGLSIGIHLLNLLTIPALVFLFFYRKRESHPYTILQQIGIFLVSVVILAFILYGVIPYLPLMAASFDRFFVNTLGLPFNVGAAFFMLSLLGLCIYGLYYTLKKKQVLLNTALLCFTMIVIGFSLFAIVIIRSSAKTPTNEYQPDNPYTLIRYLGREQYGSNPLIYGQAFDSPYDLEDKTYWAPFVGVDSDGNKTYEYVESNAPKEAKYHPEGKMLFPRMWSFEDSHKKYYMTFIKDPQEHTHEYENENGERKLRTFIMPSFLDNLRFFSEYQMNWMYWRYFMWNFAGRQNDVHGSKPNLFYGNWECGIDFIDHARLGDQSDAPDGLVNNKGKNHYYMLPLLLGLIGIFFQFARDKRGSWVTFLMFFMTGIAIVIYLNQPPFQVRERDYAYAGSFYSFSIWIGIAVAALYTWISELCKVETKKKSCAVITASAVTAIALVVPAQMAVENWDDHDRSNRYTVIEMAKNYLNSVGKNGILVTHGDNDTFPLWYAQEVEGIRTDVRVANTSLLNTDWYIDQMKWATNESAPLDLNLSYAKYLYGTNEYLYVDPFGENEKVVIPLSVAIENLRTDKYKLELSGQTVDYLPYRQFSIPVDRENVIKYGILDEKYKDQIPDEITISIDLRDRNHITKAELFMLDLLSDYKWDRPIHLLDRGGNHIRIGIKEYLMFEGFSYKLIPLKNEDYYSNPLSDPEALYYKMKNVYSWDALKRTDYFADYQNNFTFCGNLSQRELFVTVAKELIEAGENEKAIEMLDMCQESVPEEVYPLDMSYLCIYNESHVVDMISLYLMLGEYEKGVGLEERFMPSLLKSKAFYSKMAPDEKEILSINRDIRKMIKVYQMKVDVLLPFVESDSNARLLATTLFKKYCAWMSLSDWPVDSMWNKMLEQADVLDLSEEVNSSTIEQYSANLISYLFESEKMRKELEVKFRHLQLEHNEIANAYDAGDKSVAESYMKMEEEIRKCGSEICESKHRFWFAANELYRLSMNLYRNYPDNSAINSINQAFRTYWGEDWKNAYVEGLLSYAFEEGYLSANFEDVGYELYEVNSMYSEVNEELRELSEAINTGGDTGLVVQYDDCVMKAEELEQAFDKLSEEYINLYYQTKYMGENFRWHCAFEVYCLYRVCQAHGEYSIMDILENMFFDSWDIDNLSRSMSNYLGHEWEYDCYSRPWIR